MTATITGNVQETNQSACPPGHNPSETVPLDLRTKSYLDTTGTCPWVSGPESLASGTGSPAAERTVRQVTFWVQVRRAAARGAGPLRLLISAARRLRSASLGS